MRKLLLFILSSAMLVGGLYLLAAELLWAERWYGWATTAHPIIKRTTAKIAAASAWVEWMRAEPAA